MPKYRTLKKSHELARLRKIIHEAQTLQEDPELKCSEHCRDCLIHIIAHANMIIKHISSNTWKVSYEYRKFKKSRKTYL